MHHQRWKFKKIFLMIFCFVKASAAIMELSGLPMHLFDAICCLADLTLCHHNKLKIMSSTKCYFI